MKLEFIICSIYIRQVKLYIITKHKDGRSYKRYNLSYGNNSTI